MENNNETKETAVEPEVLSLVSPQISAESKGENDAAEVNVDAIEDFDPELVELARKIKEEDKKHHHIREKTADFQARIEQEIAAAIEKIQIEESGSTKKSEESEEAKIMVHDEAVPDPLVDEQWKQYLAEARQEKQDKEIPSTPISETIERLHEKLFIRKSIEASPVHAEGIRPSVPRAQSPYSFKMINAPIYDLLLEKPNLHSRLVQEYELKRLLTLHEPIAKNK